MQRSKDMLFMMLHCFSISRSQQLPKCIEALREHDHHDVALPNKQSKAKIEISARYPTMRSAVCRGV